MSISGISFWIWRFIEIITLIPIVGMLAFFVNGYASNNFLTPSYILVLFIVSVLAAAWAVATLIAYARARHSAKLVALIDLGFVGALIAGVYYLRGIAYADCTNFSAGGWYIDFGPLGTFQRPSNTGWTLDTNRNCAMLKASWAFGIMNIFFFFITFLLALLVHRHHRSDKVVVRRHSSRRNHRRSRDYGYSGSPRRSYQSTSQSRRYYV